MISEVPNTTFGGIIIWDPDTENFDDGLVPKF